MRRASQLSEGNCSAEEGPDRPGLEALAQPGASGAFWMRLRRFLERHGDPIITAANIFQLSGFACSDALHLQGIMILGNGGMALFFISRIPSMQVPFIWALLKVCVNVFMVCKLLKDRQPMVLPPEQIDIYEQHFMPFGISARQFRNFWNLGEDFVHPPDARLVQEGEPHIYVELVQSGRVSRLCKGEHIYGLDSFPGRRHTDPDGYDAGAWVGELNALQLLDTISSSTQDTVSRELYRRRLHEVIENEDSKIEDYVQFRDYEGGFGLDRRGIDPDEGLDKLMLCSVARWSVQAGDRVVVRRWRLKPLLQTCKKDHDLAGLLRKAWSQSVLRKMLAVAAAKKEMPAGLAGKSLPDARGGLATEAA